MNDRIDDVIARDFVSSHKIVDGETGIGNAALRTRATDPGIPKLIEIQVSDSNTGVLRDIRGVVEEEGGIKRIGVSENAAEANDENRGQCSAPPI